MPLDISAISHHEMHRDPKQAYLSQDGIPNRDHSTVGMYCLVVFQATWDRVIYMLPDFLSEPTYEERYLLSSDATTPYRTTTIQIEPIWKD